MTKETPMEFMESQMFGNEVTQEQIDEKVIEKTKLENEKVIYSSDSKKK